MSTHRASIPKETRDPAAGASKQRSARQGRAQENAGRLLTRRKPLGGRWAHGGGLAAAAAAARGGGTDGRAGRVCLDSAA